MGTDMLPPVDQRKGDGTFGRRGVETGEVEVLLEISGFNVD